MCCRWNAAPDANWLPRRHCPGVGAFWKSKSTQLARAASSLPSGRRRAWLVPLASWPRNDSPAAPARGIDRMSVSRFVHPSIHPPQAPSCPAVQLLFRPQLSHTDSALQLWGKYSTALNARLSASKSPSLGTVSRSIGPALVLPHKIAFPVTVNCVLFLSPRGRVLVPSPPFVLQRKLQRLQGEHARGGKWGTSESRGTMPPRGRRDALSACCARCLFPPVLWFGLDEGGAPGRSGAQQTTQLSTRRQLALLPASIAMLGSR